MVTRTSTFTVIALALLAAAPVPALASWGEKGALEPNSPWDATGQFMWRGPDWNVSGERVYLDGFLGEGRAPNSCGINGQSGLVTCVPCHDDYTLVGAGYWGACVEPSVSPNAAALGTGVPLDPYTPMAVFGLWKDCNQDGYIGLGDQGLFEYRSELLLAAGTAVCPARSWSINPATGLPYYGAMPMHNDGSWVRELIPLGWDRQGVLDATGHSLDLNIYDVNDTAARVWADAGAPGARVHTYCHVEPLPNGSLHSTGGMLSTLDCSTGYTGTQVFDAVAASAGHPELGFSDAPEHAGQSASPLNVQNPWGSTRDASFVEVYDCAQPPAYIARDPIVGIGWVGVPAPTTSPHANTDGASPAGTLGYLMSPFVLPSSANSCGGIRWPADYAMYWAENAAAANTNFVRDQSDFPMHYVMGERPTPPLAVLGKQYQPDLGTRHVMSWGYWTAENALDLAADPFFSRGELAISGPLTLTYYAHASSVIGRSFPSTTVGAYGAEACGTATSGEREGWACSPSAWWPNGGPAYGVRVGQLFELRDVDCYDASANGARDLGISYGTVTGTSC